jgi:hypothetical protein
MAGYKNWGSSWSGGYKSTSGWEKSHFGGFSRVLTDYPFIKLDFDLDVKANGGAARELGSWQAEKLVKLYILKAKEKGLIDKFPSKVIEKPSYFGTTIKKYSVVSLDHKDANQVLLIELMMLSDYIGQLDDQYDEILYDHVYL